MDKLYDRLLELLHQKPGSLVVRKFLSEVAEAPTIEKLGSISAYHFPRHGFIFDFAPQLGGIWCIHLCFEHTNGLEARQEYQPFIGEMPWQIRAGDTRNAVHVKLGRLPDDSSQEPAPVEVPDIDGAALRKWEQERAKDPMVNNVDTYHMPPITFDLKFRISDGQLISMSIFSFDS